MRIHLEMRMSLNEISLAIEGKIKSSNRGAIIEYITTDSREMQNGDLYFPFSGNKYDGENYCYEAKSKGGYFISSKHKDADITVINVCDAFLKLASYYKRMLPNLKKTVAITGSVGKTTTKEILKVLTSNKYRTYATVGNMNNAIGMSATVLSAPVNTELMILEIGMNHSGEIKTLSESCMPDIGAITKIGTAHVGNLGSVEAIARAKAEITFGLSGGPTVIPYKEKLLESISPKVTFSAESTKADFYIINTNRELEIKIKNRIFKNISFISKQKRDLECLGCAIAAASLAEIDCQEIKRRVSLISRDILRQSLIKCNKIFILDDSYNASLESVISGINELKDCAEYSRRSAVLGQIFELGKMSPYIHYRIGAYAVRAGILPLYLFGPDTKYTKQGALDNGAPESMIHYNADLNRPDITASQISSNSIPNEIILLKGSHLANLGRIKNILMGE